MFVSQRDRDVLRALVGEYAEIAALPVQCHTVDLWRRLNSLERVRPLIWVNEIPWQEMDVDGELQLQCEDGLCREIEWQLRTTLYQWRHLRGDMVVEPVLFSPVVFTETGLGMDQKTDLVRTDDRNPVVSRHFHPQIQSDADVERIQMPEVTLDEEATQRNQELLTELVGDLIRVERGGVAGLWFAPWDILITWWGVEEAMMDLVLRPELVHRAMDRLVTALMHRLDQYEQLGLLALNNNNTRIGSGGYGYTDELPQADFDSSHVRPIDLWGCATAQIFSEVSPAMHEEFALRYERRWLERFGLTYYGCCEPLDTKMSILRTVPNLRKISMSPWIKVDRAVEGVGADYVFSFKPNPAILAEDHWRPEVARAQLRTVLEATRNCVVEIILKDISTVRYEPQRLWEWVTLAREEAERVA